jgi:hypothetical protein
MGMSPAAQQQVRAKARVPWLASEHDRFQRAARVQVWAAVAVVSPGEREAALDQVQAAQVRVGHERSAIWPDGLRAGGPARMCDLTAGEGRRLRRSPCAAHDCRVGAQPADPDPGQPPERAPLPGRDGTWRFSGGSMRTGAAPATYPHAGPP